MFLGKLFQITRKSFQNIPRNFSNKIKLLYKVDSQTFNKTACGCSDLSYLNKKIKPSVRAICDTWANRTKAVAFCHSLCRNYQLRVLLLLNKALNFVIKLDDVNSARKRTNI